MAQYLDKQKNKILEFSAEDIRLIKEKKLTRRYVLHKEEAKEEIKPGNILKPQIIPTRKRNSSAK